MSTEESEILFFLRSWPNQYFSAREIGRRVGGRKRRRDSPLWAKPHLLTLQRRALVETDEMGHFRLTPERPKRKDKRFLSPKVREILKRSGQQFGEGIVLDEPVELEDL